MLAKALQTNGVESQWKHSVKLHCDEKNAVSRENEKNVVTDVANNRKNLLLNK